jgi:predicted  nucleic acid-binding Zn-ribbon protein
MIYLELTQIGQCELCQTRFYMPADGRIDFNCPSCGDPRWLYGKESIESVRIRTGMTFAPRRPDGRRDRRKEAGQAARDMRDMRDRPRPITVESVDNSAIG